MDTYLRTSCITHQQLVDFREMSSGAGFVGACVRTLVHGSTYISAQRNGYGIQILPLENLGEIIVRRLQPV